MPAEKPELGLVGKYDTATAPLRCAAGIEVVDNGPGIPEDMLADRFFRVPGTGRARQRPRTGDRAKRRRAALPPMHRAVQPPGPQRPRGANRAGVTPPATRSFWLTKRP